MSHSSWFFRLCQWSAIPFAATGLIAVGIFPISLSEARAQSREDRDFAACANELVASGLAGDTAAAACALAFRPTEVSGCVADVIQVSAVAPIQALSACSRDRRPEEVALCVSDIHQTLDVSDPSTVLTLCHRSLLPERYAACVTGLAVAVDYTTEESLSQCIAAGYRPENVAPTYIPTE